MGRYKTNGNEKVVKLEVTTAKAWREMREQGVIVPLPSGKVARLRPVGIEELVRRGKIPDDLSPMAAEVVWKNTTSTEHVRALGKRAIDMLNIIVQSAFIEPKVVESDQPGEDEISIDDIDLEDKQAVFAFVTAPVGALAYFRARQNADVADIPDGNQAGPEAEQTAGALAGPVDSVSVR